MCVLEVYSFPYSDCFFVINCNLVFITGYCVWSIRFCFSIWFIMAFITIIGKSNQRYQNKKTF